MSRAGLELALDPTSIDAYIEGFPAAVQVRLRAVRAAVRTAAPDAQERISYRMPALFQQGVLVYFGAFKHHIGLFPPVLDPALKALAAPYAGPKGNLQFPHSAPLPEELIRAIVAARLKANLLKQPARRAAAQ